MKTIKRVRGLKSSLVMLVLLVVVASFVSGCTRQAAQAPTFPIQSGNPLPPVPDSNTSSTDANAQPPGPVLIPKGSLEVVVMDSDGHLLSGIVVQAYDGDQQMELMRATTDANGMVVFDSLPAKEVYLSAADAGITLYQPASLETDVEAGQQKSVELVLQPHATAPVPPVPPAAISLSVESDDSGFYPATLDAPMGATVTLTVKQRSTHSAFGGADIKSTAFATFNVPAGQEESVSFTVNSDVQIDSYWPSSSIHKATLRITTE